MKIHRAIFGLAIIVTATMAKTILSPNPISANDTEIEKSTIDVESAETKSLMSIETAEEPKQADRTKKSALTTFCVEIRPEPSVQIVKVCDKPEPQPCAPVASGSSQPSSKSPAAVPTYIDQVLQYDNPQQAITQPIYWMPPPAAPSSSCCGCDHCCGQYHSHYPWQYYPYNGMNVQSQMPAGAQPIAMPVQASNSPSPYLSGPGVIVGPPQQPFVTMETQQTSVNSAGANNYGFKLPPIPRGFEYAPVPRDQQQRSGYSRSSHSVSTINKGHARASGLPVAPAVPSSAVKRPVANAPIIVTGPRESDQSWKEVKINSIGSRQEIGHVITDGASMETRQEIINRQVTLPGSDLVNFQGSHQPSNPQTTLHISSPSNVNEGASMETRQEITHRQVTLPGSDSVNFHGSHQPSNPQTTLHISSPSNVNEGASMETHQEIAHHQVTLPGSDSVNFQGSHQPSNPQITIHTSSPINVGYKPNNPVSSWGQSASYYSQLSSDKQAMVPEHSVVNHGQQHHEQQQQYHEELDESSENDFNQSEQNSQRLSTSASSGMSSQRLREISEQSSNRQTVSHDEKMSTNAMNDRRQSNQQSIALSPSQRMNRMKSGWSSESKSESESMTFSRGNGNVQTFSKSSNAEPCVTGGVQVNVNVPPGGKQVVVNRGANTIEGQLVNDYRVNAAGNLVEKC